MSLPSCREIRNQLFVLLGVATCTLATTAVVRDQKISEVDSLVASVVMENPVDDLSDADGISNDQFSWSDVNLSGRGPSPEDDVKTARSKILQDFEAR